MTLAEFVKQNPLAAQVEPQLRLHMELHYKDVDGHSRALYVAALASVMNSIVAQALDPNPYLKH